MEKKFSSMRALDNADEKITHCVSCGNIATHEARFSVEGATLIEKYCGSCANKDIR